MTLTEAGGRLLEELFATAERQGEPKPWKGWRGHARLCWAAPSRRCGGRCRKPDVPTKNVRKRYPAESLAILRGSSAKP